MEGVLSFLNTVQSPCHPLEEMVAAEEDDHMPTPPLRLRVRNEEVWAASMGQGYGGRK